MSYIKKEHLTIPAEPVGPGDLQDPETERLKRVQSLEPGDIVLHEGDGPAFREALTLLGDRDALASPYKLNRLRVEQYWCRVTDLQKDSSRRLVSFIGVYADGREHSRTYGYDHFFFVKVR